MTLITYLSLTDFIQIIMDFSVAPSILFGSLFVSQKKVAAQKLSPSTHSWKSLANHISMATEFPETLLQTKVKGVENSLWY